MLGGHKTYSHETTPDFLYRSSIKASVLAGAGIVTVGLLSVMVGLIADEFEPQDRLELAVFEINPKPDDLPLLTDRTPPKLLDRIEVPPPPPTVDVPVTDRPVEPVHTPGSPKDIFDLKPYIVPTKVAIHRTDSDPTPLVRVPPTMPPRASRSGHCRLSFDISSDGTPYNVRAPICSQSLFESAAIRSVQKWIYRPKIEDGLPVTRTGLNTIIRFNLTDERGALIPE
jgi:protein TonB